MKYLININPLSRKSNRNRWRKAVGLTAVLALLVSMNVMYVPSAHAAQMGQIKLVQSRIRAATLTDAALQFTVPTGVDASTDTITVTFDSGYDLGTFALTDYDFEVGNGATCSSASFTDKTLAAAPDSATWGIATTGTPKTVVTLTAPTNATTGEITAGRCVQLLIGSAATAGGAGATVVTNPSAGNYDVDITSELGTVDDSGSGSISIIANEQVTVAATVDPSITFTVTDNSVGFGTLSATAARYATGDLVGSDSDTAAHTMTVATNAPTGWAITYNGATLTSGANTIDVATITGDADGAPTTEQFAINASTSGDSTIAAGYERASNNWKFVAGTTSTLASEIVATTTETISVGMLANIAATTQAGSYTTTLTYIASANF